MCLGFSILSSTSFVRFANKLSNRLMQLFLRTSSLKPFEDGCMECPINYKEDCAWRSRIRDESIAH